MAILRLSLILALGLCIQPSFGMGPRGEGGTLDGTARQAPAEVEVRDSQAFFDDTFNELDEDIATAREEGKAGLLVMFEMDECPFCYRMKQTVLNRSDVQDFYREHFRIISVDIEGDLELTDFEGDLTIQKDFALKQHRVRATPVFLFFDLNGKPMKNGRLTGATKDAEEFLLLGRYILEGHNAKQPFSRFKREQTSLRVHENRG